MSLECSVPSVKQPQAGFCDKYSFLLLLLLIILLACTTGQTQKYFFVIILAVIAFGGFERTFGFGGGV